VLIAGIGALQFLERKNAKVVNNITLLTGGYELVVKNRKLLVILCNKFRY